jgi:hypothetical protein
MFCVKEEESGFPKIIDTTMIDGHHVILMELLGENIRNVKDNLPGKKLSLGTSLSIFYQLVSTAIIK